MNTPGRIKKPKSKSVSNVLDTKHKTFAFDGEWQEAFNQPEDRGVWIVWGHSSNNKSEFAMQFAKYMTRFGKVLYNSLEEGTSKSMKDRIIRNNMIDVNLRFNVVSDNLEQLQERLDSTRSPKIVIIDSLQYFDMNLVKYKAFKEKYKSKTIIFISHAEGKAPLGRLGKHIMYDAYIKIQIEGSQAISKGREIGPNGGIYTIWEDGAEKFYGPNQD